MRMQSLKKVAKKVSRRVKSVSVPVPAGANIRVADLQKLSDEDLKRIIKKAKHSRVGFVILNAPFKVPEPA